MILYTKFLVDARNPVSKYPDNPEINMPAHLPNGARTRSFRFEENQRATRFCTMLPLNTDHESKGSKLVAMNTAQTGATFFLIHSESLFHER